jgi:hypothetical protein
VTLRTTLTSKALVMALRAPFLRGGVRLQRIARAAFLARVPYTSTSLAGEEFQTVAEPPATRGDPGLSTHAWMRQDGPPCLCEYPSALPALVHKRCDEQR